jgi:monoterpene epsilon-lactone hydrolase
MTTLRYRLFEGLLKISGAGRTIEKGLKRGNIPSEKVPSGLQSRWSETEFQGRAVFTCAPVGHDTGRVYVHQHGGGYVVGLIGLHFAMFTKLVDMAGVTVVLPDYPLPPEATADQIIDWGVAHYDTIIAEYGSEKVMLGGDSAGGNLALAISQKRAVETPLLLLSPWVDVLPTDLPDDIPNAEILLDPAILKVAGKRYAGSYDPQSPLISPIFAKPEDLPEVMIFTGEKDLLFKQISKFAAQMDAAGKLAKLATYGEFGHYWMFYPTPDRNSTLVELAAIIANGRPPEMHSYR